MVCNAKKLTLTPVISLHIVQCLNSFSWSVDGSLSSTPTLGQSIPINNGIEEVLLIPQRSRAEASPSDAVQCHIKDIHYGCLPLVWDGVGVFNSPCWLGSRMRKMDQTPYSNEGRSLIITSLRFNVCKNLRIHLGLFCLCSLKVSASSTLKLKTELVIFIVICLKYFFLFFTRFYILFQWTIWTYFICRDKFVSSCLYFRYVYYE